jgi:hypothetical protein
VHAPANDFEHVGHSCLTSRVYLKFNSGSEWFRATSLDETFEQLERFVSSGTKYRVVAGNTGTGLLPVFMTFNL